MVSVSVDFDLVLFVDGDDCDYDYDDDVCGEGEELKLIWNLKFWVRILNFWVYSFWLKIGVQTFFVLQNPMTQNSSFKKS